ncbi:phage tail family protein [Listeria innocua]|uniref:phage tail family protein n=1 Tax=Listeria innocua TaxID=1642 RepID=UPI001306244A|nr:phage tail family protein [Listeria monocytogenes]
MYGLIFERQDGTKYITRENKVDVKEFNVPGPNFTTERVSMETFDGEIDMGSVLAKRDITFQLILVCSNYAEYILKRNEFIKFISGKEEIYVIDERHETVRWPVKVESLNIQQKGGAPICDIAGTFVCAQGLSESVGSTLDGFKFSNRKWSIGQNIPSSETAEYVFDTNKFKVYNASDIAINPERYPFIIRYKGASEGLRINNKTTGQVWSYKGITTRTDELEINQVYSLLNGAGIYGDTEKSTIGLAPGWNEIEIMGSTGPLEISFDFRFYYYM